MNSSDEIVVTGIRQSIEKSVEIKRDAINFVDAIVAEDIGKFPDENLAEALQRVPGVTITRSRGEGQNISVRGLGGDYNITTLNGRRLATENTGRTFNFDIIASELVGGLQVSKSPLAELPEGGIGSVVNIDTRKPLDLGGFKFAASAKAEYESRSKKTSPSASFLLSDTFADGTFGILIGGTYSRKTLRQDSFIGEGFFDPTDPETVSVPFDLNHDGTIDTNADGNPAPGPGSEYFRSVIPGYTRYSIAQDTRTRIGANAALQWKANDHIAVTIDGLYSRYKTNGSDSQISFVNWDESWTPGIPQVDEIKRDASGNVNYIRVGGSPVAEVLNASTPRKSETYQAGFNIKGDDGPFSWSIDASTSRAKESNSGENRYIVARAVLESYIVDATQNNLLPSLTLTPSLSASTPFGAHYSYNYGTSVVDRIHEFRADGIFAPNTFLDELHFGISYSNQSKNRRVFESENASAFSNGGQYLTEDGLSFDPSLVRTFGSLSLFQLPSDVFRAPTFSNFLSGEPGTPPAPWPSFDYDRLFAFYQSVNATAANTLIAPSYSPTSSYEVTEKLMNGYARATFKDEIFNMPFILDVGARLTRTDTNSSGTSASVVDLVPGGSLTPKPVKVKGSYFDFLPSANFKLNLTDNLIFRLSAAKVMTRAPLDELSPFSSISVARSTITRGNPGLKPFRANQADAAIEWYAGKGSLISAALYYKDIKLFTQTVDFFETINGTRWHIFQPQTSGFGGKIKGLEVALQQSLDPVLPKVLNGFGVQANYTYTTSSFGDPALAGLPFTGMSKHSYNLVGYYEAHGISTRLAYNWRSKYVAYPDAWGGPEWVAPYGQLDASFSYDITKRISVVAEATNLLNARYAQYIKTPDQTSYLARFGRQLSLGVRLGF